MNIGLVFPQTEFGHDLGALKEYAQTAEALGFTHVLAYDHIVGANPDRPGGWNGPYTYQTPFLEPFVLFSMMAAVTERLGFISGIIILPQRETTLVAKQAATLDAISGGRFRLGVGTGWNEVEYQAAGYDFKTRGKREEEQVEVLKLLWTQELVTFKGRWHDIPDAGLNPLPVQRPIPVWFGGHAELVLERTARLGDGWLPMYRTAASAQGHLDKLAAYAEQYGRPPGSIGIEARVHWGEGPDAVMAALDGWREAGATHVSLNTMGAGFSTPEAHLTAVRRFAEQLR